MAIRVKCPACGKVLKASEELVGKKCKCPSCGNIMRVVKRRAPAGAPRRATTECPKCGRDVDEGWECGRCRRVYCRTCGGESESESSLSQRYMPGLGNFMLLDLTQPDKGPDCPRCGRELRKWRRAPQSQPKQTAQMSRRAPPSQLADLLKGVPRKRKALLKRLHRHLSVMRSVNVNDWFASKGRYYGPREPFEVTDEFFDSPEAVVSKLAGRDNLVEITFNPDSCIIEFYSTAKLYALLRDPDNRFYWWNIWQR